MILNETGVQGWAGVSHTRHQAETETETKPGLRLRDSLRLSGCQSDCQDIFRLTHNLQFWPDSWHGTRHPRRWLAVFLTSKHM